MKKQQQDQQKNKKAGSPAENEGNLSSQEYEKMAEDVNNARTRKPGSQGNSSNRHNNGRGGGK
jgi:hypothetical protein